MDQIVNSSWIGTIVNNGLTDLENDLSRISVTVKDYSVSVLNMGQKVRIKRDMQPF